MAQAPLASETPDSPSVTQYHHTQPTEPISYSIAAALAAAEGVAITDLELCLADSVDVDALDTLFEQTPPGADWAVTFTLATYTIHVDATGQITVVDDR